MKCWSRSTLGVVIGILNILMYLGLSILTIVILSHLNSNGAEQQEEKEIVTIVLSIVVALCLVMIIISGILVMGIIKRRHKMMLPWLILSGLGFVFDCGRIIITVILGFVNHSELLEILTIFILGSLTCALEALILWLIYTLWRDLYRKNNTKPDPIIAAPSASYQNNNYSSLPQKS